MTAGRVLGLRLLAAAASTALALAATGCGPSAEVRFRDRQLGPVQRRIEQDKAQISGQLQVARLGHGRDARAVGQLVGVLGRSVEQLAALKAPGSVAPAFRRYVAANRRLVVSLQRFAVRLGGHSRTTLDRQAAAAQAAAGEIARARDTLYALLAK